MTGAAGPDSNEWCGTADTSVHFRVARTGMDINFAEQVGVRHETTCNLPDIRKEHN